MEEATEGTTSIETSTIDQTNFWIDSQEPSPELEIQDRSDSVDWYLENSHCDIALRIEHLQWLMDNSDRVKNSFTIFIDLEFRRKGSFRFAHLKMWNPPKNIEGSMDVWNKAQVQKMNEILEKADFIFVYGRQNDYRVLKKLGVNVDRLLLKTIDIQDFYMNFIHRGYNTLGSMSRFYGGDGKYFKRDSRNSEVRKQCVQDVKMLEFLVNKALTGEILNGTVFEDYLNKDILTSVNDDITIYSSAFKIEQMATHCPVSVEDTMCYVCARADSVWGSW